MKDQSSACSATDKVKFMISFGGRIQPRTRGHHLTYVGGDSKILALDRSVKFADFVAKLSSLCNAGDLSFKYQLPGEDLDALVSLINDDDLEIMMTEYDTVRGLSSKPTRLRIFIFSRDPAPKAASSSGLPNSDFLFGFDKECDYSTPKPEIPPIPIPTRAGNFSEQLVHWIPVTSSGYLRGEVPYGTRIVPGVVCKEQPVYNLAAGMFAAPVKEFGFGADGRTTPNPESQVAMGGVASQYQTNS